MANYFSDNFAATPTGSYDPSLKSGADVSHARIRQKVMKVVMPISAAGETAVLGKFKSGDRLRKLEMSTRDAVPTAGGVNVGFYKASFDMTPVAANIIDDNLFTGGSSIAAQRDDLDIFVPASTLDSYHRNLTLWELADIGGGTYSEDPLEDWLMVLTISTGLTGAEAGISIFAEFVSFG